MTITSEKNTLSKRVARYSRVSGSMANLAVKLAGEKYLGLNIDRDKHADKLMQSLGNLKGPLMKVGQILATIPEALPKEYAAQFQQLQCSAPPMGRSFVKRRMKSELGINWEQKFKSFEHEAAAAASLGQVHKAISHDGKLLACKLQYPDMISAIDADLNQLKVIFSLYEKYDKSIKTGQIHLELSDRLREELDYKREAKYTKLYHYMLRKESNIHIPEIIDELSTDRLLTSTWLEGNRIMDYIEKDQETRNILAMNMFRAWYVPLYHYGIIHGDPHLGNYTVRDNDLSVNLLDFGCVRVFPPKFIGGVIDLYHALESNDFDLSAHAYKTWGFKDLSREQIETLNIWANFLYGPILENKTRPIGIVTQGIYGRDTAEKVHKRLKELGTINIPREFVFMDRAALGLGSLFLHLKAEINWHKVFNELIDGFNMEKLRKTQSNALKKFHI